MQYLAIAYRWGWTNAHQYHVALTADADRCCELAQEERDDRGGKYGVAVMAWSDETTQELHAYFPSTYGEDAPHKNERIDMFEGIGHDIHSAVTTLTLWDPPATPQGGNIPRPVDPPEWVLNFVRQREEQCRFMAAVMEHHKSRRKSGLGPEDAESSKAWVEATMEQFRHQVEVLLAKGLQYQKDALAKHAEREAERLEPGPAPA